MNPFNQLNASVSCMQKPVNWFATGTQLAGFYIRATLEFNGLIYNQAWITTVNSTSFAASTEKLKYWIKGELKTITKLHYRKRKL